MKIRLARSLILLIAFLQAGTAHAETTAFINVNVLPMTDDTLTCCR